MVTDGLPSCIRLFGVAQCHGFVIVSANISAAVIRDISLRVVFSFGYDMLFHSCGIIIVSFVSKMPI